MYTSAENETGKKDTVANPGVFEIKSVMNQQKSNINSTVLVVA